MLEMKYRCDECGAVTGNPTRVHICQQCNRRVCSDCLPAHEASHGTGGAARPER